MLSLTVRTKSSWQQLRSMLAAISRGGPGRASLGQSPPERASRPGCGGRSHVPERSPGREVAAHDESRPRCRAALSPGSPRPGDRSFGDAVRHSTSQNGSRSRSIPSSPESTHPAVRIGIDPSRRPDRPRAPRVPSSTGASEVTQARRAGHMGAVISARAVPREQRVTRPASVLRRSLERTRAASDAPGLRPASGARASRP